MTRHRTWVIFAMAWIATAQLCAADWRTDPAASRLEFVANSQGSNFTGRFGKFTPLIRFDPARPATGSFDVSIELDSVNTNNVERDDALPTKDFFWTEKFPRARFTATACRALATAGRYQCQGRLSLRGKSRAIAFPFAWSGDAQTARLTASIPLNRLDFGIGTGDWTDPATIAHRVDVKVALVLRAIAPAPKAPASSP